jgi:putative ABC transport system permease protein
VREFGFDNPVNEVIQYFGDGRQQEFKVVGVIKDFNYETLRNDIRPLALFLTKQGGNMAVRIAPGNVASSLSSLESTWDKYAPGQPFQYRFLDESYDALFRAEQRLGKVFSIFTGLAILVACLGLLGLAGGSMVASQ